jgi:MFS family permease
MGWRGRELPLALYALVFVTGVAQNAIVPVLPALARHFGLSDSGAAELLALQSLATLVASVPAGVLADRYGPRAVTLGGAVLLVVSCVGQATPMLAVFVVGRVALGLAYATVWTAGVAWLAGFPSSDGARRLGAAVTISSIGAAVGPATVGAIAGGIGKFAPFGLLALAGSAVALWLVRLGPGSTGPATRGPTVLPPPRPPRQVRPWPGRVTRRFGGGLGIAILALVASGVLSGALTLLVPLQLARAGQGAPVIGLAFSVAGVGYAGVSAVVSRLGARAATARVLLFAMAGMLVALLPALASPGLFGALVVLVLVVAPRAAVGTAAYAVGLAAAPERGVRGGLAMGALNGLWATAMVVSPLLVGAVIGLGGYRAAYWVLELGLVLTLLGAAWCSRSAGLRSTPAREAPSALPGGAAPQPG